MTVTSTTDEGTRSGGWRHWLSTVLPRPCLGCAAEVGAAVDTLGLCLACRGKLRNASADACTACGRSATAAFAAGETPQLCPSCRAAPPPFEAVFAVWRYTPPFDRVIHGLKFQRLEYLAEDLASGLVRRWGEELGSCDLVVPVPLHWSRRLKRGFNQAERIAAPVARALDLPVVAALHRPHRTRPQARLGKRQRAQGANPFRCRLGHQVAGQRVLLIDDVVTTGATLGAAARILRHAGARSVVAAAAGRTPP